MAGVSLSGSLILLATALVALINWIIVRKKRTGDPAAA